MAIDNFISVTLTDEEVMELNNAFASINKVLKGKVINLTPDERRQYGSIADRNRGLVEKCKEYMEQNPETLPRVVNKQEFDRDYKARKQMELSLMQLRRVIEKLQDTKTLLDHDTYQASVAYYRYIKYLSTQNEPGTTSIYKDLRRHYKRSQAVTQAPTNTTSTNASTSDE